MIRKNAVSLILTAVLALAILATVPVANATNHTPAVSGNHSSILADEIPTPTPTPGPSTDSGVSGGGNGGG